MRAALGATSGALRRTLLAESLVVCATGAVLGVAIAQPMVSVLGRYAARFSVRALDLTLDASVLWVGVGLAMTAAVLLAFVPRLPSSDASRGFVVSSGSPRMTASTTRRLRAFAVTRVAASFVLLAGAGVLILTLLSLQATRAGFETTNVLAVNVPVQGLGRTPEQIRGFYRELQRRLGEVPGVTKVAIGSNVPWRDASALGSGFEFSVEGRTRENGKENPRAKFRSSVRAFSTPCESGWWPGVISTTPIAWAPNVS